MLLTQLRPAVFLFILLSILTGLIYPAIITVIGKNIFPFESQGSLIVQNGKIIGSQLIGQSFTDPAFFWGRPSATSQNAYNALASGGSNLGPLNPDLIKTVGTRVDTLQQMYPANKSAIPIDLVTASASGLDPDITPASAFYQAPRVAAVRHLPLERVNALIVQHIQDRQFNVLGESRVNVLQLNIALLQMSQSK